jgi:diguanylate cyclase (GGDEF)-like protein
MNPARRQLTFAAASAGIFVFAATLAGVFPMLTHERWNGSATILTAAAALIIMLVALNGLPVRGLRIRRADFSSEALFQDAPVCIAMYALVSADAAAVSAVGGFALAAALRRGPGRLDLLRQGAVRALLILVLAPFRGDLLRAGLAPAIAAPLWFFIAGSCAALFVVFACSVPFVAIHTGLSTATIAKRLAKDRRLWIGLAVTIAWSYVIVKLVPDAVPAPAIALMLPAAGYAYLLRRMDDQAVELHRLRLVRDAVQAMLGARDPLPQVNAILSSIHGAVVDEALSIVTVTSGPVDDWRVVASLGPPPTSGDLELRRRALTRLKFAGAPSIRVEDEYATMHAFAIRENEELIGALLARRRGAPIPESAQPQYVVAARDLAPLLRDIRSIAAAQSAATTDALTGLKNRAAIFERLRLMLGDVVRDGAVLLLDIDHFKRINDDLGHAAGDACLRRIAEIAVASVRSGDVVGRIGGEEFLIVMPSAGRDAAMMVGERLRLAISLSGLRHAGGDPVTASLGIAAAATGDTPETLVARADRALYEAKRSGRNRIVEDVAESA